MKSALQIKTNPLTYSRVPMESYKDVTPQPYTFKRGLSYDSGQNNPTDNSKMPKGTVFGAPTPIKKTSAKSAALLKKMK